MAYAHNSPFPDALIINGVDPAYEKRKKIRELNAARIAAEQDQLATEQAEMTDETMRAELAKLEAEGLELE